MPKFDLYMKAEMTGVEQLVPNPPVWLVHLQCTACGEKAPHISYIDPETEEEIPGSRGTANVVQKCGNCSRHLSASYMPGSTQAMNGESEEMQRIATFEIRGGEPVDFGYGENWTVHTAAGSEFHDIDLGTEGEWYEYDEKADGAVEITGLASSFERQ